MRVRSLAVGTVVLATTAVPVVGDLTTGPPAAHTRTVALDMGVASGAVRAPSLAATAPTPIVSAVVDPGDAVLVGADWGADPAATVDVRFVDADGWSAWTPLTAESEHLPDPGSAEGAGVSTASAPVWMGRVDGVQFRTTGVADDLDVTFVDVPGDLSWTPDAPAAGAAAQAATQAPAIRPRASWGADESLRDGRIDYADELRFSIIHHEGGAPRWSQADIEGGCVEADDAIRAIYAYHTQYKGYWDIAYNFVVDPCGGVWEGRYGGMTDEVMGAHAAGFNEASVGVLALGTFTDSSTDPVTDELVNGIERLLAWRFDVEHVDPDGTTLEVSGCSPGECSSRYPEDTEVAVPILSAHQVTNSTSCPGNVLMARLFDGTAQHAHPTDEYVDGVAGRGLPKAFGGLPDTWEPTEDAVVPTWEVDFTEALDWSLRITDEDGALVRATGGTGESSMARTWDLRDDAGHLVDGGTYQAVVSGTGADGDIRPITTSLVIAPAVRRERGDTRVETAVALSSWAFEAADTVVLASAAAYPDALVASPLAGVSDGPVLLTRRDEAPQVVLDELERLGTSRVLVVGGEAVVARDVLDELVEEGMQVERLAGSDRYETAGIVASRIADVAEVTELLVALGNHEDPARAFPDALSAGAFGADQTAPVLLSRSSALPSAAASALDLVAPADVRLFGGTGALTDVIEDEVRAVVPDAAVNRFAGADRYATSRLAAEAILARRGVTQPAPDPADDASPDATTDPSADPSATESPSAEPSPSDSADPADAPRVDLVFASGVNWPDALGAGAAAAAQGAVFLLTHPEDIERSEAVLAFLDDWRAAIGAATVAGGPAAIAATIVDRLAEYATSGGVSGVDPIAWPADPRAAAADDAFDDPSAEPSTSPEPTPSSSPSGSEDPKDDGKG